MMMIAQHFSSLGWLEEQVPLWNKTLEAVKRTIQKAIQDIEKAQSTGNGIYLERAKKTLLTLVDK